MKRLSFILAGLFSLPVMAAEPQVGATGGLFQVFSGLIVVLGLLGVAAWFLKRIGGAKTHGTGAVHVVGGVSVGTRERVLVVEVADQWIVVGVAPGQISSLATMPKQIAPEAVSAGAPAPNFAQWLKKTIDKRNGNA